MEQVIIDFKSPIELSNFCYGLDDGTEELTFNGEHFDFDNIKVIFWRD